GELLDQPVTMFVGQRSLLHIGGIAGSQVHRPIAAAGTARALEDYRVDMPLEIRQSRGALQSLDDLRTIVDPHAAVGFGRVGEGLVLWDEGHADPSLREHRRTRWRGKAVAAAVDEGTADRRAHERA